jgi:magnesium transporter
MLTAVTAYLVDASGSDERAVARDEVERLLDEGAFFWLDLHGGEEDDLALLRDVFRFHPLAVEDSEHFGQRSKLDEYDDYVFIVVYGAVHDEDDLVEVHCFYSERYLVTLRRDECPAFPHLRARYSEGLSEDGIFVLYRVIDGLVDSFFPLLDEIDDRIDELEDEIFAGPTDAQLQAIFGIKRRLMRMRKVVAPERDLLAGLSGRIERLPGMTPDAERYFFNLYDHMLRIGDLIDSYRDLMTGAMDVYLSTVSNRVNDVMKQLTVIATIFLPLTYITGYFGQNFAELVHIIGGWPAFIILGIALEAVTALALLAWFRKRGWF